MGNRLLQKMAGLGLVAFLLAGCAGTQVEPTATPTRPIPTEIPATATPTLPAVFTEVPAAATPTPAPALPPDPQRIAFNAMDGQPLNGLFYPADRLNAPVVVLMHWVRGDMSDWYEIAPWLQNRGLENPFPNPGAEPWWDPSWFPLMPQGLSYNVFIFSLRGCQPYADGCAEWDRPGWYADIQGAINQAATLEGVDSTRVLAIGSSIGADGVANGCAWFNTEQPGACRGAFSLSPGDFLNISYAGTVEELGAVQPASPAWCLADEREVSFCRAAGEYPSYRVFEIAGGGHGNWLLSPDLDPLPMQLILDFLQETA